MYANFKAQRDGVLELGFLRFHGTAALHESGPVHEAIFKLLLPREQTHVGADTGIGVLVKIDRAVRHSRQADSLRRQRGASVCSFHFSFFCSIARMVSTGAKSSVMILPFGRLSTRRSAASLVRS